MRKTLWRAAGRQPSVYALAVLPTRFIQRGTRRADTLPLAFKSDLLEQVNHFNRGQCGFLTFVADFAARAIEGLIHRSAGDDAESHRDSSFASDTHDTGRNLTVDVFVMRRRTLNHSSQTNHGRVLAGLCTF
jgi:hypothetical protein